MSTASIMGTNQSNTTNNNNNNKRIAPYFEHGPEWCYLSPVGILSAYNRLTRPLLVETLLRQRDAFLRFYRFQPHSLAKMVRIIDRARQEATIATIDSFPNRLEEEGLLLKAMSSHAVDLLIPVILDRIKGLQDALKKDALKKDDNSNNIYGVWVVFFLDYVVALPLVVFVGVPILLFGIMLDCVVFFLDYFVALPLKVFIGLPILLFGIVHDRVVENVDEGLDLAINYLQEMHRSVARYQVRRNLFDNHGY